jgi:Uncharacterized protein conserved in bacteria
LNEIFSKRKLRVIIPLTSLLFVSIIVTLILTRKSICLVIDGKQKNLVTYKFTVKQVLTSEGINVNSYDKLNPKLDSRITNHSTINLTHAVTVKLNIEGKETTTHSPEKDVDSFLKAQGIALGSQDKIIPDKNTKLFDGISIEVVRVEHKTIPTRNPIDFSTIRKTDGSLPNTYVKTVQDGKDGEKETVFDVLYENGKEISRSIISETFTKKPVDKIIVVGTFPSMPVSRGGQQLDFRKVISVKATAYYAVYGVGKTYTSTGVKATRNPDGYSTIAVDPKVIPYGSKVFVEGYGFAIASDTGTAIKGNWIDVFFDTYKDACKWSVKYVNVYIL